METVQDKGCQELTYTEIKEIIQENLTVIQESIEKVKYSFIAVGYYLKYVRDHALYLEDGYQTLWEFAEDNYNIGKTAASRWIKMNSKFSEGGNSLVLQDRYKAFGKSQLQEMLYLTDEQMEHAAPEMSAKEIRAIRKSEEKVCIVDEDEQGSILIVKEESVEPIQEEPLSVLGYPKKVIKEDSVIGSPGCGKHECWSCHRSGCDIRQEECWCVEAPFGNPFPCTTINIIDNLKDEIGERCQFVNFDLADVRAGDKEPVPCCKECNEPCGYECRRSVENRTGEIDSSESVAPAQQSDQASAEPVAPAQQEPEIYEELSERSDLELLQEEIQKENQTLEEMKRVGFGENDVRVRKQRLLVAALAGFACDLDADSNSSEELGEQKEGPTQPELPILKNNEQRKAWLQTYKDWGLWYEDQNIGCKYYKYDFENGARLIAEVYLRKDKYLGEYETSYLHLIGTKKLIKQSAGKWNCHETYSRYPNSDTELVQFLKFVQKGAKRR